MNYYQNYYPYGNNNSQYMPQPQQVQGINGKLVDSVDVVRATEVPIGGYGVFPRADLNEVYIKTWNNNGTTNIITFKPVVQEEEKKTEYAEILDRINKIEEKIDSFTQKKKEAKIEY